MHLLNPYKFSRRFVSTSQLAFSKERVAIHTPDGMVEPSSACLEL